METIKLVVLFFVIFFTSLRINKLRGVSKESVKIAARETAIILLYKYTREDRWFVPKIIKQRLGLVA